jgi:hypothetical protein
VILNMGLGKSLGLSLVIYIALNFVMQILSAVAGATIDTFFTDIANAPLPFIASLFVLGGVMADSGTMILFFLPNVIGNLGAGTDIFGNIVLIMTPIVPPLVASIVAGKMANSPGKAFLGWLIAMFICIAVPIVLMIIDETFVGSGMFSLYGFYAMFIGWGTDNLAAIIWALLVGLFMSMMWGVLAAILGKED